MKGRFITVIAGLALVVAGTAILWPSSRSVVGQEGSDPTDGSALQDPEHAEIATTRVERIEIPPQATFSVLMEDAGVLGVDTAAIYEASKDVYDLATIRAGKALDLVYGLTDSASGTFQELVYALNDEEELHVRKEGEAWAAAKETIAYEVKIKTVEGTVESSLYAAALGQGIDERAVIAMADVFQWTVDFAQDVRVGDTFKFIY